MPSHIIWKQRSTTPPPWVPARHGASQTFGDLCKTRRPHASPSSSPRLPLVVPVPPPRRSREGGNPAQPSLASQPRSPTTPTPGRPLPPFPRPLLSVPRRGTFAKLVVPAPPPRRSREGGNPAQPSLAYQPRSATTPTPGRPLPPLPRPLPPLPRPLPPLPRPLLSVAAFGDLCMTRRSRASPTSFPRRREPSATVTRIPTKVGNNPQPRSPAPAAPTPAPAAPTPTPVGSGLRRPLHDSTFARLPHVVPAKAGTQRNRHSHTNQGSQQPPPPSPAPAAPAPTPVVPA